MIGKLQKKKTFAKPSGLKSETTGQKPKFKKKMKKLKSEAPVKQEIKMETPTTGQNPKFKKKMNKLKSEAPVKQEIKMETPTTGQKPKFQKKMKKLKSEAPVKQEIKMETPTSASQKRKLKKKMNKIKSDVSIKMNPEQQNKVQGVSPKKKKMQTSFIESSADTPNQENFPKDKTKHIRMKMPTAAGQKHKFKPKMKKTKADVPIKMDSDQQNEIQETSPKRKKMQTSFEESSDDTPKQENIPSDRTKHLDTDSGPQQKRMRFEKKQNSTDSGPQQKRMRFEKKQNSTDSDPQQKRTQFKREQKKTNWKQMKSTNQKHGGGNNQVPQYRTGKEWKQLHNLYKGKPDITEPSKQLLKLWEELRREKCPHVEKEQLLKTASTIVKGRVREFAFAHDTVRVLQTMVSLGGDSIKEMIVNELKDDFIELSKSKYSKFLVIKMLKHGSKTQKEKIIKAFEGKIMSLIRNDESGEVIEVAFNECASAKQRTEFVEEFYGPTFKMFKDSNFKTLAQLLEQHPEKKTLILEHMMNELLKVLDKTAVRHSIVHHILLQFFDHCDKGWRLEMIESLKEVIQEILHTKEGAKVAMECIWHGSPKDRKIMIKSMKPFVTKIAMEEHGHMVLLALFDIYDDTVALKQFLIVELVKNAVELSENSHGRKVLIYLLNRRDSHYAHPDIVNKLKKGDHNEVSKKDPEIRQAELKAAVEKPLLDLLKDKIKSSYTDNSFCLFAATILRHVSEDKKEVFEVIAEIVKNPYTTEDKNIHPIENKALSFMLKQIIRNDGPNMECTLSEVLINAVPVDVLRSWINCNRGAFILVHLIETGIPSVVEKIKSILTGYNTTLAKKTYPGAEILLKKIRE